ncbi:MAG: hypothetical protein AB7E55_32005 [Pigmentiphaga sp.]
MRKRPLPPVEAGRVKEGPMASTKRFGCTGQFIVPNPTPGCPELRIIASSGGCGIMWEHVSVSTAIRCPTWDEMAWVKDAFWFPDEVVMQLHVAKDNHVNVHQFCLHLWRPLAAAIPTPPIVCV